MSEMHQEAPYPVVLEGLVTQVRYRPGWTVKLADIDRGQGSKGLTLIITTRGYNTYHPEDGETYRVNHYMPVPPASFDRRSWLHWLFEQFQLVERHECMEFFQVEGVRPYAPAHGPGNDPYLVLTYGTAEDAETSFRGDRDEGSQAGLT
jgi:hypothetical protein